jgi:hypothetical protein
VCRRRGIGESSAYHLLPAEGVTDDTALVVFSL